MDKELVFDAQDFEAGHRLGCDVATLVAGGPPSRGDAVVTLVTVGRELGLHEESIHDSLQLLDRLTLVGLSPLYLRSLHVLSAIALISASQGAPFRCRKAFESSVW